MRRSTRKNLRSSSQRIVNSINSCIERQPWLRVTASCNHVPIAKCCPLFGRESVGELAPSPGAEFSQQCGVRLRLRRVA